MTLGLNLGPSYLKSRFQSSIIYRHHGSQHRTGVPPSAAADGASAPAPDPAPAPAAGPPPGPGPNLSAKSHLIRVRVGPANPAAPDEDRVRRISQEGPRSTGP